MKTKRIAQSMFDERMRAAEQCKLKSKKKNLIPTAEKNTVLL
jgi:hypothetical protein